MRGDAQSVLVRRHSRRLALPAPHREAAGAIGLAVAAVVLAVLASGHWAEAAAAAAAALAGGGAGLAVAELMKGKASAPPERAVETPAEAVPAAIEGEMSLLAAAGHDLRQPLQTLQLLAAAMQTCTCDGHCANIAGRMTRVTSGLDRLLTALLDVARLEAGVARPHITAVDLNDCLTALEEEFEPLFASKGLRLRRVPTALWVRTDAVLLGNMLRNLISNALRYTDEGGVVIGARRRPGEVLIQVADSGRGIAEADQERIFGTFQRAADGEDGMASGVGLGLAIVRRLAVLLGHRVAVRSRPGRGSVFTVAVPAAAPPPHSPHFRHD